MIYATFSVYLLIILFMGLGIYRLWAGLIGSGWLNAALLPGTVVSEMAYIFGALITGGEVNRAKLLGGAKGGKGAGKGEGGEEPSTQASGGIKYVGAVVPAFMSIVAAGGAILVAHSLLGEPVMQIFHKTSDAGEYLARSLPATGAKFWDALANQLRLLRRTTASWGEFDWHNWKVPVFIYVAMCLAIRLAPVRRSLRATLVAVVILAALIGLVGALWKKFADLMGDIWPLLTYVWALLLFVLFVSLLVRGLAELIKALAGKSSA